MADDIVWGVGDLLQKLKALPDKVQKQGTRKAVAAAGKPVLRDSRSRVPVRTGLLKQSLANKVIKLRSGDYAVLTGAKRLKGTKKNPKPGFKVSKKVRKRMDEMGLADISPTRYLHLVELGTPHSMPRYPLRNGLKAATPEAISAMATVLRKTIEEG